MARDGALPDLDPGVAGEQGRGDSELSTEIQEEDRATPPVRWTPSAIADGVQVRPTTAEA
ncbi:hypothetical protein [Streptomyces sp. NBC_01594]|uniref:hypothetical protein n=1 Tax=Streptomyces sp. NBC_01594 TaxID=2975890 RepID=UPI00386D1D97